MSKSWIFVSCLWTDAKVPKMSSCVPNKRACDIFSHIRALVWPIICYMKEMGTMKHEQIRETLIGVLRFEILRNKGGGLYQICYYALLGVGGGVVKNCKFGCYVIIEWPSWRLTVDKFKHSLNNTGWGNVYCFQGVPSLNCYKTFLMICLLWSRY